MEGLSGLAEVGVGVGVGVSVWGGGGLLMFDVYITIRCPGLEIHVLCTWRKSGESDL